VKWEWGDELSPVLEVSLRYDVQRALELVGIGPVPSPNHPLALALDVLEQQGATGAPALDVRWKGWVGRLVRVTAVTEEHWLSPAAHDAVQVITWYHRWQHELRKPMPPRYDRLIFPPYGFVPIVRRQDPRYIMKGITEV